MAVNFGLINQGPTFAESFLAGRQAAAAEQERNMLRQMQAEQMAAQRENMLAQRQRQQLEMEQTLEDRRRRATQEGQFQKLAGLISQHGMDPDDPKVLGEFAQAALLSGQPQLSSVVSSMAERAAKRRDAATEASRIGAILGPQAAPQNAMARPAQMANALAAPQPDLLAGTPYSIGPLAAPAAAPMPARPDNAAQIAELERQRDALEAMGTPRALAEAKRIDRQLERLQPKEAEPTAGMREYQEAVRQGFKGTFMEYKQSFVPKPSQVSVKLPEQEKAFETGLGRAQAERIMEDQKVAQDARGIIDTVQQGRQLLQSGAITGFGAEALTQIGSALNQIGINFAEDAVANTQAFAANMAQNVGRIIKQFGAGTGLSNADREYAEKMAGGKITLDRKAIERILDINERAARNVIVSHNRRVQGIKTNVPLTVEMPPGPPAAAPIPGAPAAAAPAAATNVSAERANARAAIAAGAPEAAVRKRFKDKTGQEL